MDHVSFINLLPCVDLDHDYILVSIIKQSMHLIGQNIDTTTYSIDTENAKVEYLDINGKKAMYVEKEYEEIGNTNKLLWKEDDYFIGLDGIGVTKEELVKVAESVKKTKN